MAPNEAAGDQKRTDNVLLITLSLAVMVFGSFNYVIGKIRAKPLGEYDFFVTLVNCVVYAVIYWGILGQRFWAGNVGTSELRFIWSWGNRSQVAASDGASQSHLPESLLQQEVVASDPSRPNRRKRPPIWVLFLVAGICDSWGNLLGFIAQPWVPGTLYSLMTQATVPFTILISVVMFQRRYTLFQLLAAIVVITGDLIALTPELRGHSTVISGPEGENNGMIVMFAMIVALSTLPTALSFAIKESIFKRYREEAIERRLTHPELDVFLVNAHVAAIQLIVTPFAIPVNCLLGQTHNQTLLDYTKNGFDCFRGITPQVIDQQTCKAWGCCYWAPASYVAYIAVNLCFNVVLLALLRSATALWGFMCLKAVLPLSVILFLAPWPLLDGRDVDVSSWTIGALGVVIFGIGCFKAATMQKEKMVREELNGRQPPCCWPIRPNDRRDEESRD